MTTVQLLVSKGHVSRLNGCLNVGAPVEEPHFTYSINPKSCDWMTGVHHLILTEDDRQTPLLENNEPTLNSFAHISNHPSSQSYRVLPSAYYPLTDSLSSKTKSRPSSQHGIQIVFPHSDDWEIIGYSNPSRNGLTDSEAEKGGGAEKMSRKPNGMHPSSVTDIKLLIYRPVRVLFQSF